LHTLLGLHGVSNVVKNRRTKFLDGLLDTGSAAFMHILFILSSVGAFVCVCVFMYAFVISTYALFMCTAVAARLPMAVAEMHNAAVVCTPCSCLLPII